MRLLHAQTLEFEDFIAAEAIPKYAILSHTWGKPEEEVTYKDMKKRRKPVKSKAGYKKIRYCASQAIKDGLDYFWIDTCCIDKSSSAELSEAINSMFQWYQRAEVCYAYLVDVSAPPIFRTPEYSQWLPTFKASKWFTRGWTLQELIAPRRLVFYVSGWMYWKTREDCALTIEALTGIPAEALSYPTELQATSVAQRMSWAANRQTSRPEDRAYCLMGLFGVNMPLLYGEGEKAFIRLQEEIIKMSDDLSIFAWTDEHGTRSSFRGLLAKSPSEFASCTKLRSMPESTIPPYRTTNKGMEISVRLDPLVEAHDEHIAWLHGVYRGRKGPMVGIYVKRVGEKQYARVDPDKWHLLPYPGLDRNSRLTTFFVRERVQMEMETLDLSRVSGISLQLQDTEELKLEVQPQESWDSATSFISFRQSALPPIAFLMVRPKYSQRSYKMHFNARTTGQNSLVEDESWRNDWSTDLREWVLHCEQPPGTNHPLKLIFYISLGVSDGEIKLLMRVNYTLI